MADKYVTGHRPKPPTLAALVHQAVASSYVDTVTKSKKSKKPKQPKLVKQILALPDEERRAIVELLEGRRALVVIDSETYTLKKADVGWIVKALREGSRERIVADDTGSCTCEDAKFRGRICKHMEAVHRHLGRK